MKHSVYVPDVGDATSVEVIEILVAVGDLVEANQSLIVLESEKASMEVPSPVAGRISSLEVSLGAQVVEGDAIAVLEVETVPEVGAAPPQSTVSVTETPAPELPMEAAPQPATVVTARAQPAAATLLDGDSSESLHAGPGVRKRARELAIDLRRVVPTGPHERILLQDLDTYIRNREQAALAPGPTTAPVGMPRGPAAGDQLLPLSRIRRASARHLHASWTGIPHVTHFDEADISELEAFRNRWNLKQAREVDGVKLTLLPFLVMAAARTLKALPRFNASLDESGENLVLKGAVNIGIAVETDDGLMVPVIRDAATKGLLELARTCRLLAEQARSRKLPLDAMQAGTFTISSLGGIGGAGFTPIIHSPQVAILGVSRASVKPWFDGAGFVPRTCLPLSLSYDHRVIDGAEAARFVVHLAGLLAELPLNLL